MEALRFHHGFSYGVCFGKEIAGSEEALRGLQVSCNFIRSSTRPDFRINLYILKEGKKIYGEISLVILTKIVCLLELGKSRHACNAKT